MKIGNRKVNFHGPFPSMLEQPPKFERPKITSEESTIARENCAPGCKIAPKASPPKAGRLDI